MGYSIAKEGEREIIIFSRFFELHRRLTRMQWMKTLAAVAAVASVATSAVAQDRKATFGKSNDQILSMGFDAWYKFYTAKEGNSNFGMAQAPGLYADALAARNDRLLRRQPTARRRQVTELRTLFKAYANHAIEAGSATTGGGTMWNPVTTSLYKDVEEAVYGLLGPRRPRTPSRVVSDVTREIENQRQLMERQLRSNDIEPAGRAQGREAMADLNRSYRSIVTRAQGLSRRESDLVLNFCLGTVKGLIPTAP